MIVQRLAIRSFNSGAAALRLARSGYYNHCISLVRDIIETTLLLDLFKREPSTIFEWRTASAVDRDKNFSPVKVRRLLVDIDTRGGKAATRRDKTYKRFCTYGTHPSPESFVLITPNAMTQIGPFPDVSRMRAMVEEIVRHLTFATIVFASHLKNDDATMAQLKMEFYNLAERWADEFLSIRRGE